MDFDFTFIMRFYDNSLLVKMAIFFLLLGCCHQNCAIDTLTIEIESPLIWRKSWKLVSSGSQDYNGIRYSIKFLKFMWKSENHKSFEVQYTVSVYLRITSNASALMHLLCLGLHGQKLPWRYSNADLKIPPHVCVHIKIISSVSHSRTAIHP